MMGTGKHVETEKEWIELIKEAKVIGLTIEEVRMILNRHSEKTKM